MRDVLLVEQVDGDGVGGRMNGPNRRRRCARRPALQTQGDAPEMPQQHRHPVKTGVLYFAASRTAPAPAPVCQTRLAGAAGAAGPPVW